MDALGRHILVELYDCQADLLNDVMAVEQLMEAAAEAAEATLINATFHHFSPYGVSGVIVIQESHLAIHTWPEARYAAVDLFTCGSSTRPWRAFEVLKKGLQAGNSSAMEIQRGVRPLLPPHTPVVLQEAEATEQIVPSYRRDIWFTERNESLALSLKHRGQRLAHIHSPYQKIELYETLAYGKMLVLDGHIVLTEKDEYIYHEMSTHVPMQLCPQAEKVLVIGGGDGGNMRELFRYPQLREVSAVEIDEEVVRLARQHFQAWWQWEKDVRFHSIIADARTFIQQKGGAWDLIIVDAPIAVGPHEGRFEKAFFQDLSQKLKPGACFSPKRTPRAFNKKFFAKASPCCKPSFAPFGLSWCPFLPIREASGVLPFVLMT
jgi:spermidine synthase